MLTGPYIANGNILPPQMIPLKLKDEDWKKDTMDALESIARSQHNHNIRLVENYEMIKGRFIPSHYYGDEGYDSMLNQISKEFELPNYLKHYDIISPVTNTLLGEWSRRPDTFRVKDWSDKGINQFKQAKTELLTAYLQEQINIELNRRLIAAGLADAQPQSDEEAQQIQEQIDQIKSALTPPEIESYMKTDFMTAAETWGQNRIEADRQRFRLDELERKEFQDMLVADRCFRHFYLTSNGYSQETWNPVNTFYHKSPEVDYIEDGDYVGRIFILTISDIIDRYGYLMTKEQIESLRMDYKKDKNKWNEASGYEYVYNNYMIPFQGFPAAQILQMNSSPFSSDEQIPYIDPSSLTSTHVDGIFNTSNGFFNVVEAYWKSQERITLITYFDEETGQVAKKLVDETFKIPKDFVESHYAFSEEQDLNTYVHTYVNRVWKGIKINLGNRDKSIYLDIKPIEFQFKGDINIYGAKLPVCGQIFSPRNSTSMSLVDLMKPHQIGYNLVMNQLYNMAEKEVGAFLVFDVNMFVNSKDWGGEDSWEKWMTLAKSLGMVPIDTSPQNIKNASAAGGGQFPRILDLNLGAQMISRVNLAKFFEEQAYKQVGVTGIQQGAAQSQAQTETYFTQFSNYLRRCARMNLDIAQYIDSQKKDISILYTDSSLSNAFHSIMGTELLLSDLYVYVSNSQEQLRQLESLRQLGLSNNTTGASMADLAEIMTSNSPQNILRILKESDARRQQAEQAAAQNQQEQIKVSQEIATNKENKLDERLDKTIEKDIRIAEISANSKLFFNRNYTPSESDINEIQNNLDQQNLDLKRDKLDKEQALKQSQAISAKDIELQKLALKNKEIDAKISKESKDIEYARIMKKK